LYIPPTGSLAVTPYVSNSFYISNLSTRGLLVNDFFCVIVTPKI
jgi:hypothetical protein